MVDFRQLFRLFLTVNYCSIKFEWKFFYQIRLKIFQETLMKLVDSTTPVVDEADIFLYNVVYVILIIDLSRREVFNIEHALLNLRRDFYDDNFLTEVWQFTCITPVSLLANIIEIRTVLGLIESITLSTSTTPCLLTSIWVNSEYWLWKLLN